ncbi:unnamed protein product [Cuscuta campestris]|uniref:Uncharacterized protein n=1 Tax=Cuscuta campestris TaxID=132261 RepID=A0A484MKN3_9ASTE|nr:unnamed protein product [Cuscuta campestris]
MTMMAMGGYPSFLQRHDDSALGFEWWILVTYRKSTLQRDYWLSDVLMSQALHEAGYTRDSLILLDDFIKGRVQLYVKTM